VGGPGRAAPGARHAGRCRGPRRSDGRRGWRQHRCAPCRVVGWLRTGTPGSGRGAGAGFSDGVLTSMPVWLPSGADPAATAARLTRLPGVRGALVAAGREWRRDGSGGGTGVAVVMVLPDTEVGTGPAADRPVAAIRAVLPAGAMQRPTPSPLGVSTSDTYPLPPPSYPAHRPPRKSSPTPTGPSTPTATRPRSSSATSNPSSRPSPAWSADHERGVTIKKSTPLTRTARRSRRTKRPKTKPDPQVLTIARGNFPLSQRCRCSRLVPPGCPAARPH
jgi:hypothetical protein